MRVGRISVSFLAGFLTGCGAFFEPRYCESSADCETEACEVTVRGTLGTWIADDFIGGRSEEFYTLSTNDGFYNLNSSGGFSGGPVRVTGRLEGENIYVDRIEQVGFLEGDYSPDAIDAFEVKGECR